MRAQKERRDQFGAGSSALSSMANGTGIFIIIFAMYVDSPLYHMSSSNNMSVEANQPSPAVGFTVIDMGGMQQQLTANDQNVKKCYHIFMMIFRKRIWEVGQKRLKVLKKLFRTWPESFSNSPPWLMRTTI